jgi:hypothetical protein
MWWKTAVVLVACTSLALVACGGDDDSAAAGRSPLGVADGAGEASVPPDAAGGTDAGAGTKLPEDACKVLPADKTAALVPGATVTGPENQGAGGHSTAHCSWANDTRTLSLGYIAGVPHDQLELSMKGDTQDGGGDLVTVAGDDAGIRTLASGDLEIDVVHDDAMITVELLILAVDGSAPQHRDEVIALAEAADGAL